MDRVTFCPRCGTRLLIKRLGDRRRPVCSECGYIHYINPIVAGGSLVERDGQVLLVRRGVEPGLGQWGLPAGYAEGDEGPQEAARRETLEETGVEIAVEGLIDVYPFGGDNMPSGVLVLYAGRAIAGEPRGGDDALEARYFAPDDLPEEIAFRVHRQVLAEWARTRDVRFRCVSEDDRERLESFFEKEAPPRELAWEHYLSDKARDMVIALSRDEVAGLAAISLHNRERIQIDHIFVVPDLRRWGIASRMVEQVKALAARRGVASVTVRVVADNPALLLFAQNGFQVYDFRNRAGDSVLFLRYLLADDEPGDDNA